MLREIDAAMDSVHYPQAGILSRSRDEDPSQEREQHEVERAAIEVETRTGRDVEVSQNEPVPQVPPETPRPERPVEASEGRPDALPPDDPSFTREKEESERTRYVDFYA